MCSNTTYDVNNNDRDNTYVCIDITNGVSDNAHCDGTYGSAGMWSTIDLNDNGI